MTNDSRLFRTAEELEAEGAYPVPTGVFERGNSRFLPLLVGRSVHLFDRRFASVLEDEPEGDGADEGEQEAPRPRARGTGKTRPCRTSQSETGKHGGRHGTLPARRR